MAVVPSARQRPMPSHQHPIQCHAHIMWPATTPAEAPDGIAAAAVATGRVVVGGRQVEGVAAAAGGAAAVAAAAAGVLWGWGGRVGGNSTLSALQ